MFWYWVDILIVNLIAWYWSWYFDTEVDILIVKLISWYWSWYPDTIKLISSYWIWYPDTEADIYIMKLISWYWCWYLDNEVDILILKLISWYLNLVDMVDAKDQTHIWGQGAVSLTFRELPKNILAKIHNTRNHIYGENFNLKDCTCAQSKALGTRTKFQLEIIITSTNCAIHKFWDNFLESSRNVSETTPRPSATTMITKATPLY